MEVHAACLVFVGQSTSDGCEVMRKDRLTKPTRRNYGTKNDPSQAALTVLYHKLESLTRVNMSVSGSNPEYRYRMGSSMTHEDQLANTRSRMMRSKASMEVGDNIPSMVQTTERHEKDRSIMFDLATTMKQLTDQLKAIASSEESKLLNAFCVETMTTMNHIYKCINHDRSQSLALYDYVHTLELSDPTYSISGSSNPRALRRFEPENEGLHMVAPRGESMDDQPKKKKGLTAGELSKVLHAEKHKVALPPRPPRTRVRLSMSLAQLPPCCRLNHRNR